MNLGYMIVQMKAMEDAGHGDAEVLIRDSKADHTSEVLRLQDAAHTGSDMFYYTGAAVKCPKGTKVMFLVI